MLCKQSLVPQNLSQTKNPSFAGKLNTMAGFMFWWKSSPEKWYMPYVVLSRFNEKKTIDESMKIMKNGHLKRA